MTPNQAAFVHLTVTHAHEAYISFEKAFRNKKANEKINYGYIRLLIAYEPQ